MLCFSDLCVNPQGQGQHVPGPLLIPSLCLTKGFIRYKHCTKEGWRKHKWNNFLLIEGYHNLSDLVPPVAQYYSSRETLWSVAESVAELEPGAPIVATPSSVFPWQHPRGCACLFEVILYSSLKYYYFHRMKESESNIIQTYNNADI